MKFSLSKDLIIPKAGLNHFAETFATWAGVGFSATLVADLLDRFSTVSYAAYYTNAINDAVGYRFWVLLSQIALLLFCICVPLLFLCVRFEGLQASVRKLRLLTYTFFLVAFDEGCLMLGILLANLVHTGERIDMIASKSFLFDNVTLVSVLALGVLNSTLWLLGEAIYNRSDDSISGLVRLLMDAPVKYTIPGYIVLTAGIVITVLSQ